MIYMMWMITDMKAPLPQNIQLALQHHERKYGQVPTLIEHGMQVEMPKIEGVRYVPVKVPANILLLAVE